MASDDQIPVTGSPQEVAPEAPSSALEIDDTPVTQAPPEQQAVEASEPVATTQAEPEKANTRKGHRAVRAYPTSTDPIEGGDQLDLPSSFDRETREQLERIPNIKLLDSPEGRQWAQQVREGMTMTAEAEMFVPTLEDENAEFHQHLQHNGVSLMAQPPKFKPLENQNLQGERAVIRLISHLGLGTLFNVPLWHSGIWVTFKPPSESEILELNRALIADKIKFGRYTYGLAYSNTTSYTIDRLVDFALAHVYDLTAKAEDITVDNLRKHISSQDIPSLLWGFVCTMYPRGFRYRRACVADPEKCNHVLEETLNVTKLQWTNVNALSDWQRTHMSVRQPKSKDLASITRYREELSKMQKKRVLMNEGLPNEIAITIKTPSVEEYVEAGHRWIGDIVDAVDRALGADAASGERNAHIVRHGQASAMRQYSHWIDSIEYETNIINDRETIESTLDVLSADDVVRNQFITAVVDYINKSTISLIGIPAYDCPNCGATQSTNLDLPQYTNIIPLDVVQVFFGLLTQRLERMADR